MLENKLQITKLRFELRFSAESRFPSFVGNTIRGAFGRALSKQCCIWERLRCDDCANAADCAYGAVFKAQNGESVPNPYVIAAPYPSARSYSKGEALDFAITLFGSACKFENDVLCAAESMCTGSLRNASLADARLVYAREWSDRGAEHIEPCGSLTVRFVAPTEIRSRGEIVTDISFEQMTDSLFGRIADIIDSYTEGEFVVPYRLLNRKPFVKSDSQLEIMRFSTNAQPIEGVIGTVRYSGEITCYLPYIDLGSQLHIGKKTTRGCGEYIFEI